MVTDTPAVVPGTTAHWPFVPDGEGTVNVMEVLLQLLTVSAAWSTGAPHAVPASPKVR